MRVDDEIQKSVAFIGHQLPDPNRIRLRGTVFFVQRSLDDGWNLIYAVTAKHVIQGIERKGFDKVIFRLNKRDGKAVGHEVPITDWHFHPEESEVDIAILPFILTDELDHMAVPYHNFVVHVSETAERIGVGDEIYLAGLFANRIGKERNIPILRFGNIAAMADPNEKINTKMGYIEAHLVEVRSLGGISGAPVFVHMGLVRKQGKNLLVSTSEFGHSYLLGVMHGHYDIIDDDDEENTESEMSDTQPLVKERINKGIAIVVPAHKLKEVFDQPMLQDLEKRMLIEAKEEENLPTADSFAEETQFSRQDFTNVLRRASRKVSEPSEP
jgi:hypothetical protein